MYLDLPLPLFENSIAYIHEHLLKEWDYVKNKNIKSEHFSRGNKKKCGGFVKNLNIVLMPQ